MIQIIKDKPNNYTMKCQRCDGVFQYNLEDLRKDDCCVLVVRCPCCGSWEFHKNRLNLEVTD